MARLKDTGKTFNGRKVFVCKGTLSLKDFLEAIEGDGGTAQK